MVWARTQVPGRTADLEVVVKALTHAGIVLDELAPEMCPPDHSELLLGASRRRTLPTRTPVASGTAARRVVAVSAEGAPRQTRVFAVACCCLLGLVPTPSTVSMLVFVLCVFFCACVWVLSVRVVRALREHGSDAKPGGRSRRGRRLPDPRCEHNAGHARHPGPAIPRRQLLRAGVPWHCGHRRSVTGGQRCGGRPTFVL